MLKDAPREIPEQATHLRCAIYTRQSSDEGVGQEYSSLDAQRESAEAYIQSQRHAGWTLVSEHYDDGGYSGANLARPALDRLLQDIESGRIDCVVVYKVDRLSRSLMDFARLMGIFETRDVSLVSVTQQLNTTTSLGRLTLNILLSFAQFEREIIVERTRDKMSAARRRGKWVGGIPLLGYDIAPGGGRLIVNAEEAERVKAIFTLYLNCGTLAAVVEELHQRRWLTKSWIAQSGKRYTSRSFARHHLKRLLTNVIYAGKVLHRGQVYPGEHTALVEEQTWNQVQQSLEKSAGPRSARGWCMPEQRGEATDRQLPISLGGLETSATPAPNISRAVPRITRLMALAVKFEGLLRDRVVKDYADLARLGRVSRARISQIMNLTNLAPDIQEEILFTERCPGVPSVHEANIRLLSAEVDWIRQRQQWAKWRTSAQR